MAAGRIRNARVSAANYDETLRHSHFAGSLTAMAIEVRC